jgi:hypothetical protein
MMHGQQNIKFNGIKFKVPVVPAMNELWSEHVWAIIDKYYAKVGIKY